MLASRNLLAQASAPEQVFGRLSPPPGVEQFDSAPGAANGIGLVVFISNLIRVATVVAGVWVLINFILAGYEYITAGDSKAHSNVKDRLTMSILGLVIIVVSYTIAGIIGLLLFGDASFILSPTIVGPGS